jgi:hypothetical protein
VLVGLRGNEENIGVAERAVRHQIVGQAAEGND